VIEAAGAPEPAGPPPEVQELLHQRAAARAAKDWAASDALRLRIAALGWVVKDTKEGQVIEGL
jgi:cysteinyl-tRNA synthetase